MKMNYQQNPYNYAPGAVTQYAQEPRQVIMNQILTPEEMQFLKKTKPAFGGKLSKEEYLRALCCHKEPNNGGNYSLTYDKGTDLHTCSICGESFHLIDFDSYNDDQIEEICSDFNDLFQSIKTMYGAVPTEAGREIYVIGGLIKKFPSMYKVAANYFKQTNQDNGLARGGFGQAAGIQNMFAAMFNPAYATPMAAPQYVQPAAQQYAQQANRPPAPQGWMYNAAGQLVPANTVPDPSARASAPIGAGMFGGQENSVGFVDPTGGSPLPGVISEEQVQSPDVTAGFKG